jgi:hypothetical protein
MVEDTADLEEVMGKYTYFLLIFYQVPLKLDLP